MGYVIVPRRGKPSFSLIKGLHIAPTDPKKYQNSKLLAEVYPPIYKRPKGEWHILPSEAPESFALKPATKKRTHTIFFFFAGAFFPFSFKLTF